MSSLFEIGMFIPQSMISQMPAMISPQYNNRIIQATALFKSFHYLTYLSINIRNAGIITMHQFTSFLVGNLHILNIRERNKRGNISVQLQFTTFMVGKFRTPHRFFPVGSQRASFHDDINPNTFWGHRKASEAF